MNSKAVHGRLLAEDRDARLEVGRLDVGDQAPLEPVAQPVLDVVELLGRPVGGEDDLLVGVVEGVEGVEELLLGLDLALEELDVVDEQHVDVSVAALEAVLAVVADRVDELVGELLTGHVAHLGA
jgi:hypothetical protein